LSLRQEPEYPQLEQQRALPEIQPKIQINPTDRLVGHAAKGLGRKIGHSLKVSIAGYSQDDLNSMVLNGLRKQFSQERSDSFVTEVFSEFFSHQPDANTPELYELYENGDLDRVLDRRAIRWVIGRPKIRK
jgi:hypothetical protein